MILPPRNRLALFLLSLSLLIPWASSRVVQFELDLTWEDVEVAGAVRKAILSNGQLPGPALRLKQDDEVEFLVNNSLPFGTTVHFHGIQQQNTPWSDGVPGLSQTEIQPGDQFLYKWTASDYGAYIYHAHTRAQIDDGLYGPIYIEPRESVERPFHLIATNQAQSHELQAMRDAEKKTQPIMLTDWRAFTSEEFLQIEMASGLNGYCASSVLINGKGSVVCPSRETIQALTTDAQRGFLEGGELTDMGCMPPTASFVGAYALDLSQAPRGYYEGCTPSEGPTEVFHVEAASRYASFDLISMAGSTALVFSIDEHPMYVYAVDGRYVEPVLVEAITVPIGARYSVLVKLKSDPLAAEDTTEYTIRAANSYANQLINGTALLSYNTSSKASSSSSQPYITPSALNATATTTFLNDSAIIPFPILTPSPDTTQTHILNVATINTSYTWTLGNTSYSPNNDLLSPPELFNLSAIPAQYALTTLNSTWVDIIINITTAGQPQHPFHKHSNKYFVIGSGTEPFVWASVADAMRSIPERFNLVNPPLRDTAVSPASVDGPAWLAIRYFVQNPGPWLLHCHIQMHHSGGLAIAVLDGVDEWPVMSNPVSSFSITST
ncbi:putative L-ascorbate oxidase [Aspergillus heteromorphus CBS 117.55]|uniref:Putative L-ascorbate oxidase n=1 Tax=Aspergillus heteromorphus CBS 117.55 TaxID=1448321 RepID=A0A317WXN4_9EURO|nr:putative L-ascorbate oxidase [Aspergillus heteromorphus CBS 117.55]PWY90082.1 putative L-ascorbate oxidase [Aspergillus heteromorphus CBS 117.55]